MDCASHRARNLAYEEYELGFMDTEKVADWDPIRSGSLQDGYANYLQQLSKRTTDIH